MNFGLVVFCKGQPQHSTQKSIDVLLLPLHKKMFKLNLNLSKIATDEQKQDDGSQPLDSPTEDVDTATTTDSGRGSNTDAIPEDNNTSTVPKFNFSLKLGAAAENNTNETQQESVPKLNLSNISTKLALAQLEQKPSTPNSATNDNSSSRSQSSSGRNETKMPNSPIVQKPAAPFSFNLKLPLASNNSPATPADQNTTPTTTTNAPTPSTPSNISVQILTTPSSKTKTIRVDLLVSDMCTCQVPDDADMQTVQKLVYEQVCKSWFGTDNKPINSKKVLDLYKVQPLDNSTNQAGEADFVCKQTDTGMLLLLFTRRIFGKAVEASLVG